MKRTALLILLVLVLTAGSAFAHDMGDLMFNVDLQTGYLLSDIGVIVGGTRPGEYGWKKESFGFNIGLLGTVHYYFLDFVALNAGVGIGVDINSVTYKDSPNHMDFAFLNVYPVIPVGLRFSFGAFAFGGGITANIPVFSYSSLSENGLEKEKDEGFTMNKYMGWYGEIGFDLSGIKGRTGGFGLLFRVGGPFSDKIGETTSYYYGRKLEYNPFQYFNFALVFQFANEMGNFPMGGY